MPTILGDAFVEIRPELSKFAGEMTSGVGEAVTKTESESTGAFNRLAGVGKAAFIGIAGAAIGFGGAAIEAALKGQEATAQLANAVKQAGGNWDQLEPKISKTTESYAKFGYENDQVEGALARLVQITGNTTQSLDLLQVAANLAAARHIDLTAAANLVGRAAEGNITPLKRMGIQVADTGSTAGNAAAAIQALNDRFGGAAQAQADTYAGKLKAFKAETQNLTEQVGTALLPVLAGLAGDLASAVQFFENNRAAAVALGVVVGGPLAVAMATFIVQETILVGKKIADFFVTAAEGAANFAFVMAGAVDAVYAALGPFGLLAAGATALALALGRADSAGTKAAATYAESFVSAVRDTGDEASILRSKLADLSAANDKIYQDQLRQVGGATEVAKSYAQGTTEYQKNAAQIKILSGELSKLETGQKAHAEVTDRATQADVAAGDQAQATGTTIDQLAGSVQLTTERTEALATKLNIDLAKTALPEASAKVSALSNELSFASAHGQGLHDALAKLADQTATATDKTQAFKSALDLLIGGNIDAEKAVVNFQASIDGLSGKLKANKLSLDATTQAGRDNITMVEDSVTKIRDHVEALQNQGASADALKTAFDGDTTALRNQLTQAGYTKAQIDQLIASYGLVPSSLNTVITADFSQAYAAAAAFAQSFKTLIPKDIPAPFKGKVLGSGAYFPGNQPELAVVGDSREVMLPLDDPRRMAEILAQAGLGGGSSRPVTAAATGGVQVNVAISMPGLATAPEARRMIEDVARGEFASVMTKTLEMARAGAGTRGG